MTSVLRKAIFAFPFGCLAALLTHVARFGEDHAFGGSANTAIVSAASGGSIAIAIAILHAFLTAGTTTVTGTIAQSRVRAMLPDAPLIFACAAALYYGIEMLEGNGIELGLPTLALAAAAALLALTLRALCTQLARFACALACELVARLTARPRAVAQPAPQSHPLRAQTILAARRLGRAPPHERPFF
jgi:hypothetical protein